jgi:hypothetical protein
VRKAETTGKNPSRPQRPRFREVDEVEEETTAVLFRPSGRLGAVHGVDGRRRSRVNPLSHLQEKMGKDGGVVRRKRLGFGWSYPGRFKEEAGGKHPGRWR